MMRKLLVLLALCMMVAWVSAIPALTDYAYTTSMYINITPSMGAQTDYQIKFILSNASGISGYYAPDNIIYTNGTTRADWFDVNATSGVGAPLPFWIENNTATAYNATAWVKVPTVAVDNTSTSRWYYGNSSQSASTANLTNTVLFGDDFTTPLDTTNKWTIVGDQVTVSGGVLTVQSNSGDTDRVVSKYLYSGVNATLESRIYPAHYGSATLVEQLAFRNHSIFYGQTAQYADTSGGTGTYQNYDGTGSSSAMSGWTSAYHIQTVTRKDGGSIFYADRSNPVSITTHYNTANGQVVVTTAADTAKIYMDWVFIRKSVSTEPTTSLYTTTPQGVAGTPISASFTSPSNPSTVNSVVTFTDTSTGTPTTWNWTIDGSVTNTTQNAAYTFTTFGTYPINLNVTNATGHFSDVTINQVVVNVTSFTQQDIYLTGQYTITFNVKSSTTNLPIANVTVVDSVSGQSYASTNGTAFLTEPAGLIYVNFIADGYQTKQVTYVVDQDKVHEVSLTPVSPSPTSNTNTIYVPRLVRLRVVDNWRTPLSPVTITASYISDTLPNNDRAYLESAFGISSSVVDLMLNSSVAMSGVTGVDGSNTFSMFPALTYNLTVTNETMGVHCQQNLAPADTDYVLFCPTDAQKAAAVPLSQTLNRSYIWVTEPNASYVTINASYQDLTGLTTSVKFNVSVVDNNTVIYSKNFGNPGTSLVLDNYTMPNIRGMQIKSYLAYNRSA